jgi:hypothetical protein
MDASRGSGSLPVLARLAASLAAVLLAGAVPAGAQSDQPSESLIQQIRLIDERSRQDRLSAAPVQSLLDFQYGGTLDYYLFHFNDGVQSERLLQRPGLTVWTRLRADDGAHELFARMRLTYQYFNPGDEYSRQQDWVGPNFDRVWYAVDVGRALHLTGPDTRAALKIRVGRQDVTFGTGYALDLPMDAVLFEARLDDLRVQGLFGRSIGSYPNIDRSAPVDSHSARRFFGVQLLYDGIDGQYPFAYALWNDDFTDERPKDRLQNYSYDTQYFGFGSRGRFFLDRLSYHTEMVIESGRSYGDGNFARRDIVRAFGMDFGLEYRFAAPMRPRLAFDYMFASGDGDRIGSPTNAAGGNRSDREDSSFSAFGYRDTGIAAGYALSNVHIFKFGGSLAPLEKIELFRDFEVGSNWFVYAKNQHRGAVSDVTAGEFEGFLGWEMDYFINWRLASDLAWTIRWGAFFPGNAYGDQHWRNFWFTGLTWSF